MVSSGAYLLLHLILRISSKNCWNCLETGGQFCLENHQCIETGDVSNCTSLVNLPLNCPSVPALPYKYEDNFVRNTIFPIIAAAGSENPQDCLNNNVPSMMVNRRREANCSSLFPDVTCAAYTAIDHSKKVIALSIRGSKGEHQYYDLYKIGNNNGTVPFFNIGRVTKVFHDNFQSLWRSGLGNDLEVLIELCPDYEGSSMRQNMSNPDHQHYFNVVVSQWAHDGCPKNRSDYRPL